VIWLYDEVKNFPAEFNRFFVKENGQPLRYITDKNSPTILRDEYEVVVDIVSGVSRSFCLDRTSVL